MNKVIVWNAEDAIGAKEITAALAVSHSLQYSGGVIVGHHGPRGTSVDEGLGQRLEGEGLVPAMDEGFTALYRLSESGRLHSQSLKNFTCPLIKERLDLVTGYQLPVHWQDSEVIQNVHHIWRIAAECYDGVYVNVTEEQAALSMLEPGDLGIVVLRQNAGSIRRFFTEHAGRLSTIGIPIIITLWSYDPMASCSTRNLQRKYGQQFRVYGIPYNTQFTDAWNAGEVVPFFQRLFYSLDQGRGGGHPLMSSIQTITTEIKQYLSGLGPDGQVKGA
ncbi:hypothetical protein DCC85_11940 [Paenibacillus sp. CAA11]|uniref:hypothetical protein n=1 Tax=Paenibacillus sp. CAA11 TaxID=1532905 RepID=UPI000D3A0AD6|nr:hypothetical protein [Paenibacillus sp. CAA11]AWB44859.1 hypothetical protein DCC85_11940 [Paenibacillus sp. CAA11]